MSLTPLAILVVFACALAWTGFDLVRKVLVQEVRPVALLFTLTGLQVPLFVLWAHLEGWRLPGPGFWDLGYWAPGTGSIVLNLVASVLFITALRLSPLSLTIPLLSLTPVFTTLLGIPLLGEVPGTFEWVGIALVVVGVFSLHVNPGTGVPPGEVLAAFISEKGSMMMVAVALMWSVTMPLDRLALDHAGQGFHGLALSVGIAGGLGLWLVGRGELGQVRAAGRRPWFLGLAVGASAAALGLQLVAIQLAPVAVVETVKRGLGNASSAALGALVFDETVTGWQWAAVALMAVGVGCILL